MKRLDIAFDPDSKKHGVAIAINKQLVELKCMTLMQIFEYLMSHREYDIRIHIEDVLKSNAVFTKKGATSDGAKKETARGLGLCQQSATELLRMIEHVGLPNVTITKYKISAMWKPSKGGKDMISRVWGWNGQSNEETRSAAYFLALGCR